MRNIYFVYKIPKNSRKAFEFHLVRKHNLFYLNLISAAKRQWFAYCHSIDNLITLRSSCLGMMVILLPSTLRILPWRFINSPSHTSTLSPDWRLCSRSLPVLIKYLRLTLQKHMHGRIAQYISTKKKKDLLSECIYRLSLWLLQGQSPLAGPRTSPALTEWVWPLLWSMQRETRVEPVNQ